MGAAAFLLPGIMFAAGDAMRKRNATATTTPDVPSVYDPSVYSAGDTARRRTAADTKTGQKWSAERFVTSMPMLMGA